MGDDNDLHNELKDLPNTDIAEEIIIANYRNHHKPQKKKGKRSQVVESESESEPKTIDFRKRKALPSNKLPYWLTDPSIVITMKYWLSDEIEVIPSGNGVDFLSLACLNYVDITFHKFQWQQATCSLEKQILNELRVIPCKYSIPDDDEKPYFYADADGYTVNDWQLEEISDIVLDIIKPINWNLKDNTAFTGMRWQDCTILKYEQSIKEIICETVEVFYQCEVAVDIIIGYMYKEQKYHHSFEMIGELFGKKSKLSKFVNDISRRKRSESQFVQMSDGKKGMLQHQAFACLSKGMRRPAKSLEALLLEKTKNENKISSSPLVITT